MPRVSKSGNKLYLLLEGEQLLGARQEAGTHEDPMAQAELERRNLEAGCQWGMLGLETSQLDADTTSGLGRQSLINTHRERGICPRAVVQCGVVG